MRATLYILLIFLVFSGAQAQPRDPGKERALHSLLLLKTDSNSSCGSGLLLEGGLILTASHLADSLCPLGDCRGVQILSAIQPDEPALPMPPGQPYSLSLFRQFPALDAVLLRIEGAKPPAAGLPVDSRNPAPGAPAYAAGFPGCQRLHISSGEIVSANEARIETSATGGRGSSGGVLFDAGFNPVGLIIQSRRLDDAIDAFFTGRSLSLRASRIDRIFSLLNLPAQEATGLQARLLVEAYFNEIAAASRLQTLAAKALFVSGMQGLGRTIRASGLPARYQALPGLLYASPSSLLELSTPVPDESDYFETEAAFALAALEANSLELSLIELPDFPALGAALLASGRPPETVERFVKRSAQIVASPVYGLRGLLARIIRPVFLALGVMFFLWSWSLGYVYASLL